MTKQSRRMFLKGAGGFALALPFLPSLMPKGAHAAPGDLPKRFVAMATQHGGIWPSNMFPERTVLTQRSMYAGHEVAAGAMTRRVNGANASLSPVLTAPGSVLTSALAKKINVLQGVDIPFYIAHHTGGHLGNFSRNNADGDDGRAAQAFPRPTIDQIMAWSPEFYEPGSSFGRRSLVMGHRWMSYRHENPLAPNPQMRGRVQAVQETRSSLSLFRGLFNQNQPMETPVVDRVMENYRRLRNSNKRLSASDRQRLETHMAAIDEIQRRLNAGSSCKDIQEPTRDSASLYADSAAYWYDQNRPVEHWQLFNQVTALALACGASRIATMNCPAPFANYSNNDDTNPSGDWHQAVAHQAHTMDKQRIQRNAHQRFFEKVFMDLVTRLDQFEDAPGQKVLDQSLVMWTQESGFVTHETISVPIVTAGGAGGAFKTGQFIDFRNLTKLENSDIPGVQGAPGLIYNQWLGNILMAMGLSKPSYERDGVGGYGHLFLSQGYYNASRSWPTSVRNAMGEKMPFLWNNP